MGQLDLFNDDARAVFGLFNSFGLLSSGRAEFLMCGPGGGPKAYHWKYARFTPAWKTLIDDGSIEGEPGERYVATDAGYRKYAVRPA